jgi:hypothetical protein
MAGERLFEFDCDLSAYALGSIQQHLLGITERPKPSTRLRSHELDLLDFPNWFSRQLSGDLAGLGDRVWSGVFDEAPKLPLSDAELFALAGVVADIPMVLAKKCIWEPYPALHGRSVECVAEIRTELTKQTAEEWAEASAGFAVRLCARALSLAEGITVVHEWLRVVRRLRKAMGASHPSSEPQVARLVPAQPEHRSSPTEDISSPRPAEQVQERRGSSAKPQPADTGDAAVCGWKEALVITGLKKTKLYDLFGRGVLRGYRDGTMIRFYRAGLKSYMKDRENTPAAAPPRPARRPRKSKTAAPTRFKYL